HAAGPPLIAYVVPMFGLAALTGVSGITSAAIWLLIAGLAMIAAAYIGISWADGNEGLSWEVAARLHEMIFSSAVTYASGYIPIKIPNLPAKRSVAVALGWAGSTLLRLRRS